MKLRSGIHTGLHTKINNTNNDSHCGKENITIQLSEEFSENEVVSQRDSHMIWLHRRISNLIGLLRESSIMDQYRIGYEIWAVIHEHIDFIMTIPMWKHAIQKYFKGEIKNLKKSLYHLSFTPEIRNYLGNYRADLVRTLMILEGSP